jgi:hypothetical protein
MHRTSLSMNATLVKRALPLLLGALILAGNSPAWARSREHRIPFKVQNGLVYIEAPLIAARPPCWLIQAPLSQLLA